jgi:hypothetical protein
MGDVLVRYKHRLTREETSVSVAVIPFVKLPTASTGLGNGEVEGGLAVPIAFPLRGPLTMTLGPEADVLADADGIGRHLALVNLINLSLPVGQGWALAGELWTNINFDPAGTVTQASADAAVTYIVSKNLQLDAGANLGLNANTPKVELYAGVALRF